MATAASPTLIRAFVPVLSTAIVECWIIEVLWRPQGGRHCRCTLCGEDISAAHTAMIRFKPIYNRDAISMSERTMRCCAKCGEGYSRNPFDTMPGTDGPG